MTDFSDDEAFVLLLSGIFAAIATACYYRPLFTLTPLAGGRMLRVTLGIIPLACLALLLPVLLHLTSHEVVEDHGYVLLFLLAGTVWLALGWALAAGLGISYRDDALERRNPAAAIALCGAALGITALYTGANIGEGATIWMTFGPAALATVGWAALWFVYQSSTKVADAVTLDRDVSSALRLAGLLVATGVILGRAVAGDYQSAEATLDDFVREGWPALPLILIAAIIHRSLRPTAIRQSRVTTHGLMPAAIYLFVALIWLASLGAPRLSGPHAATSPVSAVTRHL